MNCRKLDNLGWRVGEVRVVFMAEKSPDSSARSNDVSTAPAPAETTKKNGDKAPNADRGATEAGKDAKPTPKISPDAAYRNSLRQRAIDLMKKYEKNSGEYKQIQAAYSPISNENDRSEGKKALYPGLAADLKNVLDRIKPTETGTAAEYWAGKGAETETGKLAAARKGTAVGTVPEGGDAEAARQAATRAWTEVDQYFNQNINNKPALAAYYKSVYGLRSVAATLENLSSTKDDLDSAKKQCKTILEDCKETVDKYKVIQDGLKTAAGKMIDVYYDDSKAKQILVGYEASLTPPEKELLHSLNYVGGGRIGFNRFDLYITFPGGVPTHSFVNLSSRMGTVEPKVRETAKTKEINETIAKAIENGIKSVKSGSTPGAYQDAVKAYLDHALRYYTPEERAQALVGKKEVKEIVAADRPGNKAMTVAVKFDAEGTYSVERSWEA